MKIKKIITLFFVIGGIVLAMAYFINKKDDKNNNHGTGYYEKYNFKKKEKTIKSKDIVSFTLGFEDGFTVDDSELMYGRYYIALDKLDDIGKLKFGLYGHGIEFETEKNVPLETFIDLQKLIENENIEEINGYYFSNTALGYFLDLEVLYESNEKINAYAEGGLVKPPGFNGKKLVEFFYNQVEEEFEEYLNENE